MSTLVNDPLVFPPFVPDDLPSPGSEPEAPLDIMNIPEPYLPIALAPLAPQREYLTVVCVDALLIV